jgi:broad specificity phosphatase PhoE
MSEMFMIRHGQASFGEKNYDRLSAIGIKQAQVTAQHWIQLGRHIDAVYIGRMQRQIDTAGALLSELDNNGVTKPKVITEAAFDEYNSEAVFKAQLPSILEAYPSVQERADEIFTDKKLFHFVFHKAMNRWLAGEYDTPGSVTWEGFKARVKDGIQRLIQKQGAKKKVAVFTSGGPISVAVQQALALSDELAMAQSWHIMNASITRFKYNPDGIALVGFNNVTHLELENDSALLTYR